MEINLEMLAKIHYFAGLTSDDLNEVKKYVALEKKFEKGQILLREDDQSEYMYFIISGSVKIFKRSISGKEQILNIASIGESLNDVSTFDGGGCAADIQAITSVSLYTIKKEDMKLLLLKFPRIALNAAGVLAVRVRRDSSLVEELSFDQVISRLARLILKQAAANGGERLPLFTQQDLAAMVGSSRVFVNRSLRVMEENKAIRLERRHIIITDERALKNMVR
jgi:CRP/FNR family transcriptional regulator, dissimilatory nitrate respiration regulator